MVGVGAGQWIAVDVIGTRLQGEIFVHSASGEEIARPLNRIRNRLGYDRIGERVFRSIVDASLADAEVPSVPGIHVKTEFITAPDGTEVGLLVWVGSQPPSERSMYNAWVLDLAAKTTTTSGDDPTMYGDGRKANEERPFHNLFTWLNPEDAWSMVSGYYDALTGEHGTLLHFPWSLRPNGAEWVHMWSSARLQIDEKEKRTLYGLTMRISHREIEANIASLVRYLSGTLLFIEPGDRWPLTSIGSLAPLPQSTIEQVMAQVDLDQLSDPISSDHGSAQDILIDGKTFVAEAFKLHRTQAKHGDPLAIILLLPDEPG